VPYTQQNRSAKQSEKVLEYIFAMQKEADPSHLLQYIGHAAELSTEHQPTSFEISTFTTLS